MTRIAVLPPGLASQIAAGEVVERPASAVKELVENALDAGAARCDVVIDGGGISRIVVSDDGAGMAPDDARLSIERHATSKLSSVDHLSAIQTFGFRGEALPSIASVTRFALRTRPRELEVGVEVLVEGAAEPAVRPVGMAPGTVVELRDLFFNVVARRKFLRSSSTESGHVTEVVETAALSHPEATFTLTRDGRRVREWLRAGSREERVHDALAEELAACRGERGPLRVEAYLCRPERARPGMSALKLFVNGRPVRDRVLAHSIAQAYGSVLERGRYPRGAVYLDLPPNLVDVNVHPQKAEVRFADARAVGDALYQVLSVSLARSFSLPSPPRSPWAVRRDPPERDPSGARPLPSVDLSTRAHDTGDASTAPLPSAEPAGEKRKSTVWLAEDGARPIAPSPETRWESLRFIAQVRQMYLICEGAEGLYVVDQHAAAERVNFDRLRKHYRDRTVASQALLFPITLDARPSDVELVEQKCEELAALGLEVRVRGPEMISVHTVPRLLARASPERLVRDLLAEVSRSGDRAFSDAVDLALATMACHGSIRAGDPLTEGEAAALLAALDRADFAGHCPHGRPIVAHTSFRELERLVGRR